MTVTTVPTGLLGEVVNEISKALDPLTKHERARVMLYAALRFAPSALDDNALWQLLEAGKEPRS